MVGLKYYKWPSNLIVRTHQRGEGIRGIATMVRVNAVCRVMSGLCILIIK